MLGVSKSCVTRWADSGRLPKPYDYLQLGRVWRAQDIEKLVGVLPDEKGRNLSDALKANAAFRRRVASDGQPT